MDIDQIPLPDQLPPAIQTAKIPVEVLQSQVVSDLVNQNEDLMARLSINLKRNAELEGRLLQEAQKLKENQRKLTLLNDQILILKEKNRTLNEKQDEFVKKIIILEKQIKELNELHLHTRRALENQVQALQSSEQNLRQIMESSHQDYERRLRLLKRYRQRIQKYIAPYILNLKSQFLQLVDETEEQKTDWYLQRKQYEKKIIRLEKFCFKVRKQIHPKIRSTTETFQKLQCEHELLVQNHEELKKKQQELLEHIKNQHSEIENLKASERHLDSQLLAQKTENSRLNELINQQNKTLSAQELKMVELENKVIEAQRRYIERSHITEKEISDLQSKISDLRQQRSEQDVVISNQKERMAILEKLHAESKVQYDRMESENMSLRALWNDARQKIQEYQLQETSLKALNQELMDKLKSERKEVDQLKAQILSLETSYQKKINELSDQMALLNQQVSNETRFDQRSEQINSEQLQRFAKMDALIAEIQTHFATNPRKIIVNELPQDFEGA